LKYFIYFIVLMLSFSSWASSVSVKDNILFAFEKCKSLSVDLQRGQLIEAPSASFDLVCKKINGKEFDFFCEYFDTGSTKKIAEEKFHGGSNLGQADLKSSKGGRLRFLIGRNFAAYESPTDLKVCVGFYLFEKDALKKKSVP
jgi:hypothetical protein